jgi:hypothetical protein
MGRDQKKNREEIVKKSGESVQQLLSSTGFPGNKKGGNLPGIPRVIVYF